jgi:hypothetical protein
VRSAPARIGVDVPPGAPGRDYFGRDHLLHGVKARLALRARRWMYARTLALLGAGRDTAVLDVGTTPDVEIAYSNFFERWYPYPDRLTTCSVEDCSALETRFPGVTFRLMHGTTLPFPAKAFDAAVSFAVLEHVGDAADQRRFLAELARVARQFVCYTPYRYFPVEMHTYTPLLHWLPAPVCRAVWRWCGLSAWADERNLNLLSVRDARRLLPGHGRATVRLVRTLGWPSHIEIHWVDDPS